MGNDQADWDAYVSACALAETVDDLKDRLLKSAGSDAGLALRAIDQLIWDREWNAESRRRFEEALHRIYSDHEVEMKKAELVLKTRQ